MRVLGACSIGGSGHLQPLLPLLDAARDAGHETLLIAPRSLASQVASTGHAYAPAGEPAAHDLARIRAGLASAPPEEVAVLGNRDLFAHLAATAMLPAMERVLSDWKPSLLLRETCEYASAVAAPRSAVRTVQVAIDLAAVEWRSLDIAAPALVALRDGVVEEIRASTYVTRFPSALDPSPYPDTRRFAEQVPSPAPPLPDWWPGSRAPLLYVTFGSVFGQLPGAEVAYRTVVTALAEIPDARVLLTVGRHFDQARMGKLPAHVHVEQWVDQGAALQEAELVVCHGGSGTTFGALAAGCPLVVVPLFVGGQFSNAATVEAAGVGVRVLLGNNGERRPLELSDAPRIREAVELVRGDPSFASRAQQVATEMSHAAVAFDVVADLLR